MARHTLIFLKLVFVLGLLGSSKASKVDLDTIRVNCVDKGILSDCFSLAYIAEKQDDLQQAKKYYQLVCQGGSWSTCVTLGTLNKRSGDMKAAAKWFGLACNDNNSKGRGCYEQALLATNLKISSSGVKKLLEKACKKGFRKACD